MSLTTPFEVGEGDVLKINVWTRIYEEFQIVPDLQPLSSRFHNSLRYHECVSVQPQINRMDDTDVPSGNYQQAANERDLCPSAHLLLRQEVLKQSW